MPLVLRPPTDDETRVPLPAQLASLGRTRRVVSAAAAVFAFVAAVVGLATLTGVLDAWLHLPAALWAAGIALAGTHCPLTHLENALRLRAGQQGYGGGFIEHYLLPVIYPAGLTPAVQYVMASIVLGVNLLLYSLVWSRRRRHR